MTLMTLTQNEQPVSNGFRVDVSRGERVRRVSSEWFSRPDDERYLSLTDLNDAVRRRAELCAGAYRGKPSVKVEASPRQCRAIGLDDTGARRTRRPHTLEFWAIVRACRRAIILYAPASRAIGRD